MDIRLSEEKMEFWPAHKLDFSDYTLKDRHGIVILGVREAEKETHYVDKVRLLEILAETLSDRHWYTLVGGNEV